MCEWDTACQPMKWNDVAFAIHAVGYIYFAKARQDRVHYFLYIFDNNEKTGVVAINLDTSA